MTDLIEVEVERLCGAALDWAVSRVQRVDVQMQIFKGSPNKSWLGYIYDGEFECYSPSRKWEQTGDLIEKYITALSMPRDSKILNVWPTCRIVPRSCSPKHT